MRAVITRHQSPHLVAEWKKGKWKESRGLSLLGCKPRPLAAWERDLGETKQDSSSAHGVGETEEQQQAKLSLRGYIWRFQPIIPNNNREEVSKSMAY